jgi:hypothetical protein
MKTKIVYSFHPDTRVFVGPVTLDEGDLSPLEPGVWHIPGNCLEVPPPESDAGHVAFESNGAWLTKPVPVAHIVEQAALTPVQQAAQLEAAVRERLDAMARAYRYDDIADACSYAVAFDVPKFYAEGKAFQLLRSLAWEIVEPVLDSVVVGGPVPTVDELLAMLPLLDTEKMDFYRASMQASKDAQAAAKLNPEPAKPTEKPPKKAR